MVTQNGKPQKNSGPATEALNPPTPPPPRD